MTARISSVDDGLRLNDWFCGAGGATQGGHAVPGIMPILAANHDQLAIDTHSTNFPQVEHFRGDIKDLDVATHPYAEIFWASPECTNWSVAKGRRADYALEPGLFDDDEPDEDVVRSRALMEDVVRYLRGMNRRGQPVLAGVVENVIDIRKWTHWNRWLGEIRAEGYRTRLIALNSAHARSRRTPRAPQSRDRLYLAYWHESLGRDPDWNTWLRPECWCSSCEEIVAGVQHWKRAGNDMGRYDQQYVYVCPKLSCRGARVEPFYLPAREAIDWSIPGQRIGDRDKPLSPKTMARIEAALLKWGPAIIEAAGHTFERRPGVRSWPLDDPLRTLHTTATKALVEPFILERRGEYRVRQMTDPMGTITANETTKALLVPVEGRDGKQARSDALPLRTQTARNDLALLTMLRGQNATKTTGQAMDTVTASGDHHALLFTNNWSNAARSTGEVLPTLTTATTQGLLVPYYSASRSGTPTDQLMGTLTTNDRFALVMRNNTARGDQAQMSTPVEESLRTITTAGHQSLLEPPSIDIMECLFRMLEPHEIGAGMAFQPDYVVLGNKRQRVRQYGNAVTPPVAEILIAALVECIQGHPIDWNLAA